MSQPINNRQIPVQRPSSKVERREQRLVEKVSRFAKKLFKLISAAGSVLAETPGAIAKDISGPIIIFARDVKKSLEKEE